MSSEEALRLADLITYTVHLLLGVFGCTTNILNILVFVQLGFQNHVNTTLCTLAVSDFCHVLADLIGSICALLEIALPRVAALDLKSLDFNVFSWIGDCSNMISTLLIVYISTERSLCVVFPFQFRNTVTKKKNIAILIAIYIFNIAFYVNLFATLQLGWVTDVSTNATRQTFIYTKQYLRAVDISYYFRISLTFTSDVIVITTTGMLIVGLHKASSLRKTMISHPSSDFSKDSADQTLTERDQTLVKTVLAVAVIFILANMPHTVTSLYVLFVPGFRLSNNPFFIFLSWNIYRISASINASVNIFVFYTMNSKFRAALKRLLCA